MDQEQASLYGEFVEALTLSIAARIKLAALGDEQGKPEKFMQYMMLIKDAMNIIHDEQIRISLSRLKECIAGMKKYDIKDTSKVLLSELNELHLLIGLPSILN